ncbi:hypothetical protein [Paramicrobacterium agarici]|uniref:Uncharacterized protein n=1 Tax=Paramicrobacterium agarici TaxID=630514 RepID=A0A2A9DX50_9MICO|nr:hypothetical protein [Microbacterium agarici]PFG31173.1 hypothetical protein ATJ78_2128 [Microbacterium agarici]
MGDPENSYDPWRERFIVLIEEVFNFLSEAAEHHRSGVSVKAEPRLFDRNRRAVYRLRVRGELVPFRWADRVSTILFRARSILDIVMFHAVAADSKVPLTEPQARRVYFPIVFDESQWQDALGKHHLRLLSEPHKKALRSVQPFVTGNPAPRFLGEFHNRDKHRRPIDIQTTVDEEFVMLFSGVRFGNRGSGEYWIDWEDPMPAFANGAELVTYRTTHPMISAAAEDVPIAPSIIRDGQRFDLQHLLWDLLSFVTRAEAVMSDGNTSVAESMAAYFEAERTQLESFKKMMLTGDETEWLTLVTGVSPASGGYPTQPA